MTSTIPSADAFLLGGGSPSAKFPTVGTSITGAIAQHPEVQQQRDFTTGVLKFWDDGKPQLQLKVVLQTEQRDNADDDGLRAVYVKGQMRAAVADAIRKVGAESLEVGGTLTVTYTGDAEPKQRGMNGAKQYTVAYVAPKAQATAEFLGTQPAAPAAPPAPAGPQFSPEQLAAMKAAGVDVSALTG